MRTKSDNRVPNWTGPFTITLNCPKSDGSLSDAHAFPPHSSFQTLPRFTTSYAQASRTQTSNWKWLLQRILQKVALEHYIEKVLHLKESAVMDPPMGGTTFFLFFLTIAKMDTQNLESFGVVPNCVFFLHNRLLGILVPVNRFYFIVCLQCGIYYCFSLGTLHIVPFEIYSLVLLRRVSVIVTGKCFRRNLSYPNHMYMYCRFYHWMGTKSQRVH